MRASGRPPVKSQLPSRSWNKSCGFPGHFHLKSQRWRRMLQPRRPDSRRRRVAMLVDQQLCGAEDVRVGDHETSFRAMSALPMKTDLDRRLSQVPFVPKSDAPSTIPQNCRLIANSGRLQAFRCVSTRQSGATRSRSHSRPLHELPVPAETPRIVVTRRCLPATLCTQRAVTLHATFLPCTC